MPRGSSSAVVVLAVTAMGMSTFGANLNLVVREASSGQSNITVPPGAVVEYEVVGQFSDTSNGGLALWGADLDFDGGDLAAADIPISPPMNNFTPPLGISNPYGPCPPACGYGGTIIAGNLVQVGGGQNTIINTVINAPYPVGTVIENVGHAPVVLLTSALTAPMAEGTYHLSIPSGSVFGNQIKFGEDAVPFYATEAFGEGTITQLVITVGCELDLVSEAYPCDATWPRLQKNTIRLTFSAPITPPPAGAIEIRELLAESQFGATNHASNFIITVEGGNTLKLVENGDILTSGKWYAVMYRGTNWTGVCNFERDHAKVKGDADGSGNTNFSDLGAIFGYQGAAPDTSRYDIDGSGVVNFLDINQAFAFVGSFRPSKPAGHGCTPIP